MSDLMLDPVQESSLHVSGIYKIWFDGLPGYYIGSAKSIHKRFLAHLASLRRGTHANYRLQRIHDMYGAHVFHIQIEEVVLDPRKLYRTEQKYLDRHVGQPGCYNIAPPPWLGGPAPRRKRRYVNRARRPLPRPE
jgi:hypothetical protein